MKIRALIVAAAILSICAGNSYCAEKQDDKSKYSDAIEKFSAILKANPNNAVAHTVRGLAYNKLGKPDLAIADFNKAIEINPLYSHAYSSRGFVYSEKNETKKALADFDKAIELNKSNDDAYYNRGLAYYRTEQYTKSLGDYKTAAGLKLKKEALEDFTAAFPAKNKSDTADVRSKIIKLLKTDKAG